jgi:hypothetical protein
MATLPMEHSRRLVSVVPVFTGTGRWLAAVVVAVAGPVLQAIEFALEGDAGEPVARVADWAANPARIGLAMASGFLAVPFLICGVAVLVALTRQHSRRLAWLAATFMTFGMAGLAAVHGYEMAAYGLVQSGNQTAAIAVLNGDTLGVPGAVLLLTFFGGAALGTITLAVAAWRSPFVPRIVVVFMLAFAALDFAAGYGVASHLVNLAGFVILAGALVRGYSRRESQVGLPG